MKMGSFHFEDLAVLQPKNLLARLMVNTIYDTRFPMEVLPDVMSNLDNMEYPIAIYGGATGLSERVQGTEANMSGIALDRAQVKAVEYAEKMQILENDSQILVNVRNQIVDALSNFFILLKQEMKYKYLTNSGSTAGATNSEVNTWTGAGIQGTWGKDSSFSYDGYYLKRDVTTDWEDNTNGDPFSDLGAAKRRIQEEENFEAEWLVMSSRMGEVLIKRPDIQKILADNSNLATAEGGSVNMINRMRVAETDVIQKSGARDPTETRLNRTTALVTSSGSNVGLTHVSERENFVVTDKLNELRAIQIELRTKFVPWVQRPRAIFQLIALADNS